MIERKLQKYAVNTHPATFGAPEPKDSPVMTSSVSSIPAGTDHGSLSGLLDDDHIQYLRTNGVRQLLADWDAGSWKITAKQLESDIATGTAPLIVVSTTKVTNLNADLLDSQSGAYYLDSANFTGTNWTDLTDAGATTLHKHDHGLMDGLGDDDHTQYIFNAPTTDTRNVIQPSTATVKGLILKGAASQSDNLLEFQDSAGAILSLIDENGRFGFGVANPSVPVDVDWLAPSTAAITAGRFVAKATDATVTGINAQARGGTTTPKNVTGGEFTATIRSAANESGWTHAALDNSLTLGNSGVATISSSPYTTPLMNKIVFNNTGNLTFPSTSPVAMAAFRLNRQSTGGTVGFDTLAGLLFDTFDEYGSGTITATNLTYAEFREIHGGKITSITNTIGLKMLDLNTGYSTNNTNFLLGTGTTGNWSIYNNSTKDNLIAGTTAKVHWRDTAIHIASLDDGHLDLTADVSIDLNGAVVGTSTALFTRLIVDDTGTYIDKDGSNNMIFVDAVTGSKTLAELAAGGDVGEGHITIFPFDYSSVFQGTWSFLSLASQWGAYVFRNSSTAINDALDFQVYLEAGTYSLSVLYVKFSTYGIMEFYNVTDASSIGTIDGYAAGVTYNQLTTLTGYVVSSAGLKTIRMRSTTKNASSSAYQMSISSFAFFRTA